MRTAQRVASGLTERQHEIVMLSAAGLSIGEIAARLVVTRSTVKAHLQDAHDASYSELPLRQWIAAYARAEWERAHEHATGQADEYGRGVADGERRGRARIIAALRPVIEAAEREVA